MSRTGETHGRPRPCPQRLGHLFPEKERRSLKKTGSRRTKKLLYAAWRVNGTPTEIRELYRRRFGIESSYRQLGLARIRTCTTDPVLRLFFVIVALVLRNVWVWLHFTYFAERLHGELQLHLECLRFRRMLNWIAQVITNMLHDGSDHVTQVPDTSCPCKLIEAT